jgi:hypothetical protein
MIKQNQQALKQNQQALKQTQRRKTCINQDQGITATLDRKGEAI